LRRPLSIFFPALPVAADPLYRRTAGKQWRHRAATFWKT